LLGLAALGGAPPAELVLKDIAGPAGVKFVLKNHATPNKYQVETMPAGVAVLDFDNDGFEDLFFVNGASIPALAKSDSSYWNRLFRNRGDGTFTDVTTAAGVAGGGYSMAAAAADFDNDGWADLFVAGVNRNILYHNNGNGTFTDVTEKAGLTAAGPAKMWSISAGWFDYDNDGWLDLFVSNYCRWAPDKDPYCGLPRPGYRTYCHPRSYEGLPNSLYHNNRDGTFSDVSAPSGVAAKIGKGMGVAFADYNGDGRMDVFVANDTEPNFLFHNDGGGRFTECGVRMGVAFNENGVPVSSMGADFRDVDNDGRPDVFVTALSNETFALFHNLGPKGFQDASYPSGIGAASLPWGGWSNGLFDLDNDGWKDIFVAGSHVMDNEELYTSRTSKQPNRVFLNLGQGRFRDVTQSFPDKLWKARFHRGCAFGDFDNDGRVDIAVSALNEPALLLHNESARRHWLVLELQGTRSNRDGIGAAIRVVGQSGFTQFNHVTTSVGYASSSSKRVFFGLGPDARAQWIEIRWPSGTVQTLRDVPADRMLRVTEPR
jgi:hypothetical protein